MVSHNVANREEYNPVCDPGVDEEDEPRAWTEIDASLYSVKVTQPHFVDIFALQVPHCRELAFALVPVTL